jgi:2-methylcitrate dehydratase PrpD
MPVSTSLTQWLAAHLAGKPISAGDRRAAALFVLDTLANALAGRNTPPGVVLRRWQVRWAGQDAGREAFAIGALAHILETDDLHRASVVHPGCVVVPAAWAMAHRQGARGHALLDAVLWGYEAACRVGQGVGPGHYRIWHNTATCGPFGAAAAAGRLLGLGEAALVHAFGNAGSQSAGLWEFLETGAMTKHLHAGRAAEAGVVAATLAAEGFTGPPAILEGARGLFAGACPDPAPEAVRGDPDAPWQLHLTSMKPWPSCRHTHPAIDAALELAGAVEDAGDIASITVRTYPAGLALCDRPVPDSDYAAKFSMQHCVAAALADGHVGFDSFDAAARDRLAPLRGRVSVVECSEVASAYPAAWGAVVTVTAKNGDQKTVSRRHAKGDPESPLSREDVIAKARQLLAHSGIADADRIIDGILALEQDAPLPVLPLTAGEA